MSEQKLLELILVAFVLFAISLIFSGTAIYLLLER